MTLEQRRTRREGMRYFGEEHSGSWGKPRAKALTRWVCLRNTRKSVSLGQKVEGEKGQRSRASFKPGLAGHGKGLGINPKDDRLKQGSDKV